MFCSVDQLCDLLNTCCTHEIRTANDMYNCICFDIVHLKLIHNTVHDVYIQNFDHYVTFEPTHIQPNACLRSYMLKGSVYAV